MTQRELFIRQINIKPGLRESGSYTAALPLVSTLLEQGGLPLHVSVTFFVGENGSGKSTLLEAAAVAAGLNPEGGTRNFNFATAETHSDLADYVTLVRGARRHKDSFFLRGETLYNVASEIDRLEEIAPLQQYYGGSLHKRSHGESVMDIVQNRLGGTGLYILDEPEAALSPNRQMALLIEFKRLVDAGSQILCATHSPILLALPGAEIYEIREGRAALTPYKQTAHYADTRRFLLDPESMLALLLRDDDE